MTQRKPQTPESKALKKLEDMREGFAEDFGNVFKILDGITDANFEAEEKAEEITSRIAEIRENLEVEAKLLKRFLIGWSLANFMLAIVVIALLAVK